MKKVLIALFGSALLPLIVSAYSYDRNLTLGSSGNDVIELQTVLIAERQLVLPEGVSKGYFGSLTQEALRKYQALHNIFPALGYFGPLTRTYMSALLPIESGPVPAPTKNTPTTTVSDGKVVSQEQYFGKQITKINKDAPKITSISETMVGIKDKITIHGENFGSKVTIYSSVGILKDKKVSNNSVTFAISDILGNLSEVKGMPITFSVGNSKGVSSNYGYIVIE
jgi:peptidoglycan hydrolase-like protein with peptidoglycan-binding domain